MQTILISDVLKKARTIGIFGDVGSGKTALAFKLLECFNKEPIYFINHPQPDMIEDLGYHNIIDFNALIRLQDSVIYWDEPQLSFSGLPEYRKLSLMVRLLSLMRQKGNVLIMSSSDTRVFQARLEAYIGMWLLKSCDFDMVKQRSKIRSIIKKHSAIPELPCINLKQDELLAECVSIPEINGKHKVELADCWSEELSCAYKTR